MNLLAEVLHHLARQQMAAAVVGGVALAAHGIARATLDTDVFVVESRALGEAFWTGWNERDRREVFHGDSDEPLAGSVRITRGDETVDIVVGRPGWQSAVLERRTVIKVQDLQLPVVDRADLVLLKLLAGGPQDLVDIQLLIASDPIVVDAEVESRISALPKSLAAAWQRFRERLP